MALRLVNHVCSRVLRSTRAPHLLYDCEVVVVWRHARHEAVLPVERDLARVPAAHVAERKPRQVNMEPCPPHTMPATTPMRAHACNPPCETRPHSYSYGPPVLADERVQRVAVGHPSYEPAVGRQRDDGVSRDGQVALRRHAVVRQHGVDQPEQLHHALVLAQVLVALRWWVGVTVIHMESEIMCNHVDKAESLLHA